MFQLQKHSHLLGLAVFEDVCEVLQSTRSNTVGTGTELQARKLEVQFPIVYFIFR